MTTQNFQKTEFQVCVSDITFIASCHSSFDFVELCEPSLYDFEFPCFISAKHNHGFYVCI